MAQKTDTEAGAERPNYDATHVGWQTLGADARANLLLQGVPFPSETATETRCRLKRDLALYVLDDLLAGALVRLSHRPLLGGYDEPETLSYQIALFGPISADVRQWLGKTEAQKLKVEMAAEMADFWETIQRDVDWDLFGSELGGQAKHALSAAEVEIGTLIENMSFEQFRNEWETAWIKLKERLPANYAQLDEVPDEKAVSFVLSCLEDRDREAVQSQYPQDFWSNPESRKTGELAGLAFMLFMCGLVRDRRVKKGNTESRMQYFRGQFRDGVHIENAARCPVFITCDKGAARLARSLYAYTGIETKVVELQIRDAAAR